MSNEFNILGDFAHATAGQELRGCLQGLPGFAGKGGR